MKRSSNSAVLSLTLFLTTMLALLMIVQKADAQGEVVLRVIGGESQDYVDEDGNTWLDGDLQAYDENGWGGYLGDAPPSTTAGQANDVVDNETEYDDFLFKNVVHGLNERTYGFNLESGEYTVTFLFSEHWSATRGFSVKIDGEYVLENYVTVGPDHTPVVERIEGVSVAGDYMEIYWESAPDTGAGDLNPIFSAIEIIQVRTPVNSISKLATTWGRVKNSF